MADDDVIATEDPIEVTADDRPLARSRTVDVVVSLLILAVAMLLGWDSWRTGAGWASDGPQAGYFPFYLSLLMGAAAIYGIVTKLLDTKTGGEPFVTGQ